jgi:hypothetical protein
MLSQPRAGKSNWCHGINRFIHQLNTLMTVLTLTAAIISHGAHDSRKADREKYKAENGLEQIRFAAREVACRPGFHIFVQHSKQQLRTARLPRSSVVSRQSFRFPGSCFLLLSVSIPSLVACLLSGFLLRPNLIHHYQRLDYSTTIILSSV